MPETDEKTSDQKPTRDRERRSARRPPFFAILLLSAFLLLVLSFITFRQLRAGEANRLRLLAGFAEQVEATVPELVQRFSHVVERSQRCRLEANLEHVPNVSLLGGPTPSEERFRLTATGPRVHLVYPAKVPQEYLSQRCPEGGSPSGSPSGSTEIGDGERPEPGGSEPTQAALLEAATPEATQEDETAPAPAPVLPAGGAQESEELVPVVYHGLLDLEAVVRPIVIPEAFDLIVLARRSESVPARPDGEERRSPATVLFQHGEPELKLAEVDAAWEVRGRGFMETLRNAWRDEGDRAPGGGGTRVVETEIAGSEYRVFLQPVTLHLVDVDGNPIRREEWLAAGVISWERLLSSSVTTSPVLLFLMVALVPLMLVGWPFLKMWLISRRQEFTRFDVAALTFSILAGLSLLTLLALDFVFVSELRAAVNDQLKDLGRALQGNLHAEVADALHVQAAVSSHGEVRDTFGPVPEGNRWEDWVEMRLEDALSPVGEAGADAGAGGPEAEEDGLRQRSQSLFSYPFLHSIAWLAEDGWQESKIPFHGDSVLRNDVSDRGYFLCPQEPELAAVYAAEGPTAVVIAGVGGTVGRAEVAGEPLPPGPVCVQSIRSKTTAGDLAVLSTPFAPRPSSDDDGPDEPQEAAAGAAATAGNPRAATDPPVVALVTRFVSLTRPLLPPGFAFAVVDRRGQVLFHSDPRRNVSEDFLRGTAQDRVLAALLDQDREGPLDLDYWGTRYQAWVEPIHWLPSWYLITLRSTRDLRTRNFELIYDFLNPFLLYMSLLCLALLLVTRFVEPSRLRHLWPSRELSAVYRDVVRAGPLLLGAFALFLVGDRHPVTVALAAVLVPLAACAGLFVRLRRRDRSGDKTKPDERRDLTLGWARAWRAWRELEADDVLWFAGVVLLALLVLGLGGLEPVPIFLAASITGSAVAYVLLRRSFLDRTTVAPYVSALAMILFLVAVVPTVGFFSVARSRQLQFLIQDGQMDLLRQDVVRLAQIAEDRGPLGDYLGDYSEELEAFRTRMTGSFFQSEIRFRSDPGIGATEQDEASVTPPGRRWLWPYGRRIPGEEGSDEAERGDGAPGPPAPLRRLARLLSARPFPTNELTPEPVGTDLSRFGYDGATWQRRFGAPFGGAAAAAAGERAVHWLQARRTAVPAHAATGAPIIAIASVFPPEGLPADLSPLRSFLVALVLAGLLGLTIGLAAFLAKKVVLIELAPNRRQAALDRILDQVCKNGRRAQRLLVRTSLPAAVEQMARGAAFRDSIVILPFTTLWHRARDHFDRKRLFFGELQDKERQEQERARAASGEFRPQALLITDLRPDIEDPAVAAEQIELLQKLQRREGEEDDATEDGEPEDRSYRSMVIVTSRPYHRLTGGPGEAKTPASREARARWHAYLARFGQRQARDEGKLRLFTSWIDWQRRHFEAGVWPPADAILGPAGGKRRLRAREPNWFLDKDLPLGELESEEERERFPEPAQRRHPSWRMRRLRVLLDVVLEECRWTWRLQRVGIDVIREIQEELLPSWTGSTSEPAGSEPPEAWSPPTKRQLVNRIGAAAQPYYERVWDGCEDGEKQVLHQLARHGVVNPKSFDDVLDLLNKGLVVREDDDPVLRLMNRSFADFVRRTVRRQEAWRWEEEGGPSAWNVWKWVLPIPLLLLAAFLFITQQDALSNVVGLVVALASLVPTGVNLYQHFQRFSAEAEGSGAS